MHIPNEIHMDWSRLGDEVSPPPLALFVMAVDGSLLDLLIEELWSILLKLVANRKLFILRRFNTSFQKQCPEYHQQHFLVIEKRNILILYLLLFAVLFLVRAWLVQ